MNVIAARIRAALETDNNARFYAHAVIWVLIGIVLVGRGLRGLLPHDAGYTAVLLRYYAVTFTPGATTVWHGAAHNHDRLWSWLWGLWFLAGFALPIHFGIAFYDELVRGFENVKRRLAHESGGDQVAGASTPAAGAAVSRGQGGGGLRDRTIAEILTVEFLAEFVSEAFFRFWRKIRGGGPNVG